MWSLSLCVHGQNTSKHVIHVLGIFLRCCTCCPREFGFLYLLNLNIGLRLFIADNEQTDF